MTSPEDLLQKADEAMYLAKAEGRNRIQPMVDSSQAPMG